MSAPRRTTLAISAFATLFVLATAVYTGNSGLFILAALAASSGVLAWQHDRRRR